MTDDTTTTQLAQDDTALESAVVDATFATQEGTARTRRARGDRL